MNYDVVVVGAGAVGGSVAFHLAEKGVKVALLDRGFPGCGTSRATQAGIGVYPKKPRANLELNMKGAELYPLLVERLGRDVELRMDGVLNLAMSEADLTKMQSFVAKQRETPGYKVEMLTGDEARSMEPALSHEVVGAAYCPLDGQVNSLLYTDALARGVVRCGGHFFPGTQVENVAAAGEHLWSVSTTRGTMEAPWVVDCAGAEVPRIGRMVGIEIPIVPSRGHVLVTEALPPIIKHRLSGPTLIRQTVHGNMLLGRSEEIGSWNKRESLPAFAADAKTACRVLPCLEKVNTVRVFVGLRPWPPDGLPIIGEIPGLPGFLVAVGHSGVTWSPAAGMLLSELITTGSPSMPLAPYSITRFEKAAATA